MLALDSFRALGVEQGGASGRMIKTDQHGRAMARAHFVAGVPAFAFELVAYKALVCLLERECIVVGLRELHGAHDWAARGRAFSPLA